jgi:hypothetical protein
MAIVINGSGTVTGLAVGGLPDGTVDAGTLATNSVDSAELIDGAIDTSHIAANQITSTILPTGSVLQVVQAIKLDTFTMSSTTFATITGLSAAITPTSTSSKILVFASVTAGHDQDDGHSYLQIHDSNNGFVATPSSAGNRTGAFCVLNSTTVGEMQSYAFNFLSSPSTTSAITYNIQARSTATIFVNRSDRDTNNSSFDGRGMSTITLMEIAG